MALFPMGMLVASAFFPQLAEALVQNDRTILAAAGGVAIFAVLEPNRRREETRKPAAGKRQKPADAAEAKKSDQPPKPGS